MELNDDTIAGLLEAMEEELRAAVDASPDAPVIVDGIMLVSSVEGADELCLAWSEYRTTAVVEWRDDDFDYETASYDTLGVESDA